MDILQSIKDMEKKKLKLQKRFDKIYPKYDTLKHEVDLLLEEIGQVDRALSTIQNSIRQVTGLPPEYKRDAPTPETAEDEIVSFLHEYPNSTSKKVTLELDFLGASKLLPEMVKKGTLARTRTRERGPWLYFVPVKREKVA